MERVGREEGKWCKYILILENEKNKKNASKNGIDDLQVPPLSEGMLTMKFLKMESHFFLENVATGWFLRFQGWFHSCTHVGSINRA